MEKQKLEPERVDFAEHQIDFPYFQHTLQKTGSQSGFKLLTNIYLTVYANNNDHRTENKNKTILLIHRSKIIGIIKPVSEKSS